MISAPTMLLFMEDDSDRAFMEQLYIDHAKLMYAAAISTLGNAMDAEDAVHEAILRLNDKIALLRGLDSCTLRRYIVVTVRRVAINFGIKKGRDRSVSMDQEIIDSKEVMIYEEEAGISADSCPVAESCINSISGSPIQQSCYKHLRIDRNGHNQ